MPQVNYAMAFEDVVDGQWYTEAVRWAASIDVVGGYSAEEYGTDDYISRQDMATILYRYAAYKGYDVSMLSIILTQRTSGITLLPLCSGFVELVSLKAMEMERSILWATQSAASTPQL